MGYPPPPPRNIWGDRRLRDTVRGLSSLNYTFFQKSSATRHNNSKGSFSHRQLCLSWSPLALTICTILTVSPFCTNSAAAAASGSERSKTVAGLIQCPHWQSFAPVVHLASAAERKSRPAFPGKRSNAVPAKGDKVARDKTPAARIVPAKNRITSNKTRQTASLATAAGANRAGQPESTACPTHKVRAGETLFSIAAQRLGNGRHWASIRSANPGLDPTRLKPGMLLIMPCGAADTTPHLRLVGAAGPKPTAAKAAIGTGKAGATSTGRKSPAKTAALSPTRTRAPTGAPAATQTRAPTAKPQPVWTAKKGETFRAVIERWAKRAGHTVIIDTSDAWTIHVPVELRGDFKTAIGKLVRGLSHDGVAPPVRIYPNRVVRVGL